MADTDILVSEMTPASQINTTDLMIMTQPDAQAETGYNTKSGTVLQVANKMLKGTEYSTDLPDFTDKTPLGGLEELKGDIQSLLPVATASGNPCNFNTGVSDNLVSCKATIVASGGNGTPATPIPIVGKSELNLVHSGANLWDEVGEEGGIDNATGQNTPTTAGRFRSVNYILCNAGENYSIYNGSGQNCLIYFYDYNKTYISYSYVTLNAQNYGTFTAVSNACYMRFRTENNYGSTYLNNISINYPSTDTSYHAYNGQTFTIPLGQTVYGGVLDVKNGSLTLTHSYIVFDGSEDENWLVQLSSGVYRFRITVDGAKGAEGRIEILANIGTYASSGNPTYGCFIYGTTAQVYYIPDQTITTVEAFKTWLGSNNLEVVYPLATPIEITGLTPTDIQTIIGVNNITSDVGGAVEVEFRDSIQNYIDKKIAQTQALIL